MTLWRSNPPIKKQRKEKNTFWDASAYHELVGLFCFISGSEKTVFHCLQVHLYISSRWRKCPCLGAKFVIFVWCHKDSRYLWRKGWIDCKSDEKFYLCVINSIAWLMLAILTLWHYGSQISHKIPTPNSGWSPREKNTLQVSVWTSRSLLAVHRWEGA